MGGLEFIGLELLAVLPVHDPFTGGLQMLASRNRGRATHDRYQILTTLDLHLEDSKAILRVVVGDSFDEAGEGFRHGAFAFQRSAAKSAEATFKLTLPSTSPTSKSTMYFRKWG